MYKKVIDKLVEKKLLVVAILLFLAINIIVAYNSFSEKTTSSIWDGKIAESFSAGTGSVEDPYIINNGAEFAYFMQVINGEDYVEYFNKNYELRNNIDLNGYNISFSEPNKTFSGSFNGNGYSIFNFVISDYYIDEETNEANYYLFPSLYNSNIKNLNLSDITFKIDSDILEKEEKIEEKIEEKKEEKTDEIEEVHEEKHEELTETICEIIKYNAVRLENEILDNNENTEGNQTTEEENKEEEPSEKPDKNTTEEPITEEPITEEPVVEEPTEEPTTKEPIVEEPTEEPTNDDSTSEPVAVEDSTEENQEPEQKITVNHINASLFGKSEQTKFSNININNITVEFDGDEEKITSSLFLLEDVKANEISNIIISGDSSISNTTGLINNYSDASVENVFYNIGKLNLINNYEEDNKTLIEYSVDNDKMVLPEDYDVKSVLEILNSNSDLEWTFEDNKFRIINLGTDEIINPTKAIRGLTKSSTITDHASGIESNTVYVNDLTSDYNYFKGLNYTEIRSTSLPSETSTGYYNDDYLVKVEIIYDGADINNSSLVGAVSPINSETANKFIYYKYYALERNSNGTLATDANGHNYIRIELIDNPFTKRPYVNGQEYGFNGWVCNQSVDTSDNACDNSVIYFKKSNYTRYMDVAVDDEDEIIIHLNASWYRADVVTSSGNISNFHSMEMVSTMYTTTTTETITGYAYWNATYYTMQYVRTVTNRNYMDAGTYYRRNTTSSTYTYNYNRTRCPNNATCYVYNAVNTVLTPSTQYTGGSVVFVPIYTQNSNLTTITINNFNSTYMTLLEDPNGPYTQTVQVIHRHSYLANGANVSGFFYKVSNPTSTMISTGEYYDANGSVCTSTSSCSTAYKLIRYNDEVNNASGHSIYITEENNGELVDVDKYYYLVTRDLNIFRYTSTGNYNQGLSITSLQVNVPYTVTGTAVNGTSAAGILNASSGTFTASNDIVIENIRIYGPNKNLMSTNYFGNYTYNNLDLGDDSKDSSVFYANSHNMKLGRNITSSRGTSYLSLESIFGGTNSAVSGTFRVIVESGTYYSYHSGRMSTTNTNTVYTINETTILGADYDRITNTNNKLRFTIGLDGFAGGHHSVGSDSKFASFTYIKSGSYGYNYNDTANTNNTSGLYIGGRASTCVNSITGAKIEGGQINTVVGGYGYNGTTTTNSTYIGMSGGTVRSIYGGAGHSTTKGNRILNITGGNVSYSILGGSDSYDSGDNNDGIVQGSTLVYVGGNVIVGGGSGELYGVESGSVFGAGGGDTSSTQKGTVYNSHVIINGGTINTAVYGGGNHGSTGTQNSATSTTKIEVLSGTIGAVYGGSKSADFGRSNYQTSSRIDIDIKGGTIGSVYGGSNDKGTIYGTIDIEITSGNITGNVYGGGRGGVETNPSSPGTTTSYNVGVTIGNSNGGPSIGGNVYGGSAFGSVNGTNSGNVTVTVNDGNITGYVFGGGQGDTTHTPTVNGTITVTINGGSVSKVFGGNDQAGSHTKQNEVHLNGGLIGEAFGGGNKSSVTTTHVYLAGSTVTNIYGGSNTLGNVTTANVAISSGSVTTVYGGNNEGGTCGTTNIDVTGGTVGTIYGGGNLVNTTTTNIDIYNHSGNITAIYGGGNQAGATTTNIDLHSRSGSNNISVSTVYGGSNQSGNVTESNITIDKGTVSTVYGGNNAGGKTVETNITVNNGTITTIYGGGNEAESDDTNISITGGTVTTVYGGGNEAGITNDTNVTISGGAITSMVFGGGNEGAVDGSTNVLITGSTAQIPTVFGGGNKAGANETNVTLNNSANVANVYGGSNQLGTVTESNVTVNNGSATNVYGGNNAGGQTTTTNVILAGGTVGTIYGGGNEAVSTDTNVTVNGGSVTTVFGGGNKATVSNDTHVTINNCANTITTIYGGGNRAGASETYVTLATGSRANTVYGGSNQLGNVTESHVSVTNGTITNVYGGNNAGDKTLTTNVTISGGTTESVFGGGNVAESNDTHVTVTNGTVGRLFGGGDRASCTETHVLVNDGTIDVIYAGGNAAAVSTSTDLDILGGTVNTNIYGGGNEGVVGTNTDVLIHNATVLGSAYAGGNGSTATVLGNTTITVSGTSVIGASTCTVLSQCSVFGGGNAAVTGSELTNNSLASVNIKGATVYGNVYGGANTSKVYGATNVKIGADVPAATNVVAGDVLINGTVFGGGEANASGSDEYDWTFVSVTNAIDVLINGNNYENFAILGSIFGSGNASTTTGTSEVTIKNYGTFDNPQRNTSIQRTDILTIDNSAIVLIGATDRENEYSDVLFSLSRIKELDLKNNSTLYLETGANLLEEFKSLTSTGAYAEVEIDAENKTVTKNVDNRVYMYTGKILNIAKDQSVTDYGEVSGMTFFGMYKYNGNGTINTGIYDKFDYDETLDWGDVFDNVTSYVLGLHKTDHDIEVDGFYTNYIDEATAKNVPNYIEPTPPTGPLYMWTIGEGVIEYEIDLVASKYSTLGTYELSLRDFTDPNTSFQILGFDYSELDPNVQLINKNNIKKIADTDAEANALMGLSMETSNIGWLMNGYTQFLSNSNDSVIGTEEYIGGNNESAPTLLFYLHHSKNVTDPGDMGKVRIQLMSVRQIDALTKETKRLIITVNLSRVLYDTINYEGAMTAGRKYDLFTSTATNITSSSSISAYYSLFNAGSSIYRTGYHRALISNYVFPLNTKITMIDLAQTTPEYYYKIITAADVAAAQSELNLYSEVAYDLSMFEAMGALNSGVYYDDAQKNIDYCSTGNYCNEEYIFIIDFGDTNITTDALNNKLLIEIRDSDEESIFTVLAPQHLNLMYNIYTNKDAIIDMEGEIDRDKIYNGETLIADMTIDYTQSLIGSTIVYDTHYFDSKLGIKISLINSDDEVVTGTTLLGLYYEINGVRYYPNIDGTARIKIADKVDSAEKWVIVNTGTSTIRSGTYTLRFESFGSPDGIYYGLESSDTKDFEIEIVNEIYGLDIETTPEEMIIDSLTGNNANEENTTVYNIIYNSGLTNPSIRLKMYRRNYTAIDDTSYSLVDAQDYFDVALVYSGNEKEYKILSNPNENTTVSFTWKDDLMSGTYKMQFILYDDNSAIGTVDKYIIIK